VFTDDGVAYVGGAFVLKRPFEVGASWQGEHEGTVRVTSLDVSVAVPAGKYASCMETVEDGARTPGVKYVSTFCPGVGLVRLEVARGPNVARAELKSYGFPVVVR
jgi:hypothetical protein